MHRLFQRLTDLGIAGHEGVLAVAAVGRCVLREQQAVTISDGDNDAWADHRIGECAAGRALHRTFISGRVHLGSAAAAVGVVCVPGMDLVAGDAGESEPSRNGAAQNQCVFIFPDIKFRKLRAAQFIVIGFVDTEQKFCFFPDFRENRCNFCNRRIADLRIFKIAQNCVMTVDENEIGIVRCGRVVIYIIFMRSNVLNHKNSFLW